MRGRPRLFTKYQSEMALVPTWTKRTFLGLLLVLLILIPLQVIPPLSFLGDSDWMRILSEVLIFAVGALGLHILSGLKTSAVWTVGTATLAAFMTAPPARRACISSSARNTASSGPRF